MSDTRDEAGAPQARPPRLGGRTLRTTQRPARALVEREAQEQASVYALHPAFGTLPAALLALASAVIVVPHAAEVEPMEPLVYATAFACALFFVWLFYHMAMARRAFLMTLILLVLLPFLLIVAYAVWEQHAPQRVWSGEGFTELPMFESLAVAAVLLGLSGVVLPGWWIIDRILRTTRQVSALAQKHLGREEE
jgi:hypothetical protein